MNISVLIASPDNQLRLALNFLLNTEACLHIVGSASNVEGLVALAKTSSPDLLLLDERLLDGAGSDPLADLALLEAMTVWLISNDDARHHRSIRGRAVIAADDFSDRLLALLRAMTE